jgi:hypothetical protein
MVQTAAIRKGAAVRQMPCREQRRLLDLYAQATAKLWLAVSTLANTPVSREDTAFARDWESCEQAHKLCSDLRSHFYDHLERHGCGLQLPVPMDLRQRA